MKKRIMAGAVALLLIICVYACPVYADSELSVERLFAAPTYYDTTITLPTGKTMAYYAQNEPLWGELVYESRNSTKMRLFREGGCAPTSVAMALRCILDVDELLKLSEHYKMPYSLCQDSLNRYKCEDGHTRYFITSAADYAKFLPVVLGDFATGNNDQHVTSRSENGGTVLQFIDVLVDIFGFKLKKTDSITEAAVAAQTGCGVMGFAASNGAFTSSGHYLILADADEEYYYFLDPLCRTDYSATDKNHVINVLYQGLVSIRKENIDDAQFYSFVIFSK